MTMMMNDDEAKLYDRSIRLWGVEAQNRSDQNVHIGCGSHYFSFSFSFICLSIRSASVLLVGVGALNGEVCKNIALAGVKRIGLLDNTYEKNNRIYFIDLFVYIRVSPLREEDLGTLFLASSEQIGTPVRYYDVLL